MGDREGRWQWKVTQWTLFAWGIFVGSNTNFARQAFDQSLLPIVNYFDLQKFGFDRLSDQSDSLDNAPQTPLPPEHSGNRILTDTWQISVFEIKHLGRQLDIHGTGYDALGEWIVVGFKAKNTGSVADNIYSLLPALADSNGKTYEADALASGFYANSQGVDLLLNVPPNFEAPFYLVFDAPTHHKGDFRLKVNPF